MDRTALITGVGGQDGSYLTEFLLDCGYKVHGFDCDPLALAQLGKLLRMRTNGGNATLYQADVTNMRDVQRLVTLARPSEIYNLAAQTRVDKSFVEPILTAQSIAIGTANLLESMRTSRLDCRFYQASSSEMFGDAPAPQGEDTDLRPISPYACAKVYAHHLTIMHRETYGMHACAGILFNHESPRRSRDFVSRRITNGIAEILSGKRETLTLGNLNARRDWGHARDYVRAMWLILQRSPPTDYVIASGLSRSVSEFADLAFSYVGLDWRDYVVSDPALLRPTDPTHYLGDAARARRELGWETRVTFEGLVHEMLAEDLRAHEVD